MSKPDRLLIICSIVLAVAIAVAVIGGVTWNLGEPARIAKAKAAAEAATKAAEKARKQAIKHSEIARQKAEAAAKFAALQDKARLPVYTVNQLENLDNKQIRGKWFAVCGYVMSKGPGMINPYIKLQKKGLFNFCCNFSKEDEDEIFKVQESQQVIIAGLGQGVFSLDHCFFYNLDDPENVLARLETAKKRAAASREEMREAEVTSAPKKRPVPRVTPVDPKQTIPVYEVLDRTRLADGSGETLVDVLVESFSRATPVAERERVVRVIAAREGTTFVDLYCTRLAMKANYSLKAKNANPGVLENGYLGQFRHNKFKIVYPVAD